MHTCQEVTEIASDYLEGRLSWSDWATLRLHLVLCPPCQHYIDQIGQTVDALAALDEPPSPEVSTELEQLFRQWAEERGSSGG